MENEPVRRIRFKDFKAISRAIVTYEDINLLVSHIVEYVCRSIDVRGCAILLYDDRENQLFRVASCGISDAYLKKGPLHVDEQFCSTVTHAPVFIEDMQNDSRVQYPEAAAKEGLVSMLSIPIRYRHALIGILRIYNGDPWPLHDEDLDSFCLLGDHLGLVVENSGLKNFLDHVKMAMENLPLRMLQGI